jgi:hypothetical protein
MKFIAVDNRNLYFWNFSDPFVEVNAVVRHFRQYVLIRKIWQSMCENLKILEN